jgi:hypothetical protein
VIPDRGGYPVTASGLVASCSFCLKSYTDVGTLVAGPGVYICDECVALSSQLIAGKPKSVKSKPVRPVGLWEAEAGLDAVLAALPRVARAGKQAEFALTQYVRKARQLGSTWATIGETLGMARQSAWERFSGEE